MTEKNFVDEFNREITVAIYYAENSTDTVYASITRDGGRLGEFILANGRVYACRGWDELNQTYKELVLVNPYDKVAQILVGDPDVLLYLERFTEKLSKIRGQSIAGRRSR